MADFEVSKSPAETTMSSRLPEEISKEDEDCDLGDICQVVLSFKCKFCTFLGHDKNALTKHFRELHFPDIPGVRGLYLIDFILFIIFPI